MSKLCDEHAINEAFVLVGFVKYVVEPLILPVIRFAGLNVDQGEEPLKELQLNLQENLEMWLKQPGAEALEAADYVDRQVERSKSPDEVLPPRASLSMYGSRKLLSGSPLDRDSPRGSGSGMSFGRKFRTARVNSIPESALSEHLVELEKAKAEMVEDRVFSM